ncbi:hypothetical protein [Martelella soudanensis]|uniref:hypothetical protein n=1 Tax=unclassified Martelella TaxID=2629616 RepID=UPI0015DF1FB2|nr:MULTISPECIES: hypothetical protein [unclassified Martelella]
MKTFIAAGLLLASFGTANAQEPINRYDIQDMTCNQVLSILRQQGAAILRYPSPSGSGRILYDRYVDNAGICFGQGGHAIRREIPTKDTNACPTLSCKPGPPECDDGVLGFDMFGCIGND